MLLDKCERLKEYYPLDDKLIGINSRQSIDVPEFNCFHVDRSYTNVFTVNKGSALFATSWRENPSSMESTAVVNARQGEFVLYLPGEPMLVKVGEESEVSLFRLDE